MNSYFASVEQQANPFLRGRPVGVCAYLNNYSCIIASSIEAKLRGVKTGLRVPEARRICSEIVLVQNDPKKYRSTTKKIFSIFAEYTHQIEPYSIDEAFLVVDGEQECVGSIATTIKKRIREEIGEWLRCSIGIAPTRWLAKVGSDFQKPNGLTIVTPEGLSKIYDTMKLTDAWGIGERLEARLNRLGIYTLNELRTYPLTNLMEVMGIRGYELWANANGVEVVSSSPPVLPLVQSIGHSYCLPRSVQGKESARRVLMKLCEKTTRRLREDGREAWAMNCVCNSVTHRKRYSKAFWDSDDVFREALKLIGYELFSHRVQFLAVTLTDLRVPSGQLPLWEEGSIQRNKQLCSALDAINNRYGEYAVIRGSMWGMQGFAHDRIGFRKSVDVERPTTER